MKQLSQGDVDCVVSYGTYGWLSLEQPLDSASRAAGWFWTDGTPQLFTHWGAGEPSDGTTGFEDNEEQCAHTYSNGDWNDRACDTPTPMPLICTP